MTNHLLKIKETWDVAKSVLNWEFKALNTHTGKEERNEINNLNFYLRQLENEEQINSKVSRRINKIRAEMNKIKNRKPVEKDQ